MKNIKVEPWEKFGLCYLRIGPVKTDEAGEPVMKGEIPERIEEDTVVIAALPAMRKSRDTGVFSQTWTKIRSVFNARLEEVTDSAKRTKGILRGLRHTSKVIIPRVSRQRSDGRGGTTFFTTQLQIEDYAHGPNDVIGSLGVTEKDETPKFTELHRQHLMNVLNECQQLGCFRGATGKMDFSEGRSELKKLVGKMIVWDLCDDKGNTIEANIGDPVAAQ